MLHSTLKITSNIYDCRACWSLNFETIAFPVDERNSCSGCGPYREQQDDKTEGLQQCEKAYSFLQIIVKASLTHITETDAMSTASKSTIEWVLKVPWLKCKVGNLDVNNRQFNVTVFVSQQKQVCERELIQFSFEVML